MTAERHSAQATPNHAAARILVPIAALVLAALGLLAGALWYGSASQDELARQHERQLIGRPLPAAAVQTLIERAATTPLLAGLMVARPGRRA